MSKPNKSQAERDKFDRDYVLTRSGYNITTGNITGFYAVSWAGVEVEYNGARETWSRERFAQYLAMARTAPAYEVERFTDPYDGPNHSLSLPEV